MASTDASTTSPLAQPSNVKPTTEHTNTTAGAPPADTPPADTRLPYPFSLPTANAPAPELIAQGAEALLYRTHYLTPTQPAALKVRPSKKYRHRTLDERLTKQRLLAEARVLVRLSGVGTTQEWKVPAVYALEWDVGRRVKGLKKRKVEDGNEAGESSSAEPALDTNVGPQVVDTRGRSDDGNNGAWLLMEWVDGLSAKELVRRWDAWIRQTDEAGKSLLSEEEKKVGEEELKALLRRIGRAVAGMHSKGGVVHGDLTSSNLLVRKVGGRAEQVAKDTDSNNTDTSLQKPDLSGEIVLIDFGLATQSVQDEDRAVDLYVLERAFGSTHPRQEEWFDQEVLQNQDGYRGAWKGAAVVLKRLEDVRLRGRKRSMIG